MKIGFAVTDITPEPGIYLTGYGMPERLANGVHSPLTATAAVMDDGEKSAAVISLDWCVIDWELTCEFRNAIFEASGIEKKNILLSCTHTHSAPHTTLMRTLGRVAADPENKGVEYARKCIPAIVDAVLHAKAAMRETAACFAEGKTEVGVSRRGMDRNGIPRGFIADPDAICDNNMTAMLFKDAETMENIGIIIHCSAHNTSMGLDFRISSDWCGVMKKRVGNRWNVPVLFLNGAIGDVGPRTNRWVEGKTFHGYGAGGGDGASSAEEVGFRAASDALRLLENMKDFRTDLPLKMNTVTITLPQEIPMTEAEAEEILSKYDDSTENSEEPPADYQVAKVAVETWKKPLEPDFFFEQTVIAFGPVALAPFPFEMFSIFSLRLRKYGNYPYTLLCSNVNGRNAYMPDRGAIAYGGYEVNCRKLVRPYVLKDEAGDLAVSQTLDSLDNMK
ncbi:MAG: neutral/alkaline non-lysosomal ceramidase N-terminal domain-containing protein [Lentisphaeria bacterium]|nr:neutral/alkaline non-lysosomal ceramidase N-terminal domain-containing protein [Lentisphaeria bacterium]